ncbi:MAG: 4'-phosphopantetheinyl transferase superfamily protein [Deltaproteobacteria bacterium]|nr:4'-phosphopantetheinyl transferase superfamily protein [Deltaproteobacteria bacterium]
MPRTEPPAHSFVDTPHGRCVLVTLDDDADALARAIAALPELEQTLARQKTEHVRREFVAGRTALHLALGDFAPAIGAGRRGAPVMPEGFTGSVSHKRGAAIAIVAPIDTGWVGVDLEHAASPRFDISTRILTAREQQALPADDGRGRAVTLRFAIKEAIYKAVDPIVERYVGFTEVELDVGDGFCAVESKLPAAIEATWREHAGHWIATARAIRR